MKIFSCNTEEGIPQPPLTRNSVEINLYFGRKLGKLGRHVEIVKATAVELIRKLVHKVKVLAHVEVIYQNLNNQKAMVDYKN